MTSREQFEAWAEESGALPWGYLKKQRTQNGGYSVQIYNYMWSAWQASHEAVAVELPDKKFISEDEALIPEDSDWPDGFNTALEQCAEAIRAAGIKVKGE
ncbi:hypothetical protein [Obesumbacterium proteus]|uniref:hypothetical protein n=1 Tax=Obesumbacterium proteus TaxID=82983 RepID=UPI001F1A2788|nr:hypothetical protein [Obesumbacterium proteus]MCE9886199.1 hypothetical protein [Obesumbacterium proteus]MCE9914871.1 hypothetical protein [Obesumbacterium proteus]MCE9931596.1 hypothetical protein [Obesumbacterium proteus]MCG2876464.1 hypothetical protein [Obesumbacterium proteus]